MYGLAGAPMSEDPAVSVWMMYLALKLMVRGFCPNMTNFVPGNWLYIEAMYARHAAAVLGYYKQKGTNEVQGCINESTRMKSSAVPLSPK